jgi:hypothetical protein
MHKGLRLLIRGVDREQRALLMSSVASIRERARSHKQSAVVVNMGFHLLARVVGRMQRASLLQHMLTVRDRANAHKQSAEDREAATRLQTLRDELMRERQASATLRGRVLRRVLARLQDSEVHRVALLMKHHHADQKGELQRQEGVLRREKAEENVQALLQLMNP